MSTQNGKSSALDFFANHPVFTHQEFAKSASRGGEKSRQTTHNILAHHLSTGRLLRVRRGLYATVLRGISSARAAVDPYLVATKLADDAIVAYHAALQFHGKAYSVSQRFTYLARRRARPFRFRQTQFVPVQVPAALRRFPDAGGGILERRHAGGLVRVTTLERTLVDVLDAPNHGGGWEELWRSLETVEFFDLDAVVAYALKLKSALTVARVGFFLDQHRDTLMVEERHLEALRAQTPAQPRYLDRRREPGKLIPRWNLVVPQRLLSRAWSEVT
jgi:predicted transcriptional regulator of viral defense system